MELEMEGYPKVLQGQDVDVLSPFPETLLPQAVQWLRCHPTLTMDDSTPKDDASLEELLRKALHTGLSYAVVDRHNLSRIKSTDIPVVGILTATLVGPWNAYLHVASTRRAWGAKLAQPGLIEQGARLVLQDMFESHPSLLRLSALALSSNAPARGLCQRLGFRLEGSIEDVVLIKGEPKALTHYGLTRRAWQGGQ